MFAAILLFGAKMGLEMFAQSEQNKANRETSRYNEQMQRREADKERAEALSAMEQGRYDMQTQKRKQRKLKSAQSSAMADSGSLMSGTLFDVSLDQAFEFSMDNAMLSRQTTETAKTHTENATLLTSQADGERWKRKTASKNAWASYAGIAVTNAIGGIQMAKSGGGDNNVKADTTAKTGSK